MVNIKNEKINLCVIFGGESTEYEISLRSATSVIENLDKEKYNIITIGITKDGRWRLFDGAFEKIINDSWYSDDLASVNICHGDKDSSILVERDGKTEKIHIDAVFPVLHGANGEDGTIQGLFELAGIKYVGTGVLTSCVGMDKTFAKIVFEHAGILQADWVVIHNYQLDKIDSIIDNIEQKLGYPVFVKPANAGSSVGINKASDRTSLKSAIQNAFKFDRKVLVEEFLKGREVECAVIGKRGQIRASCVGEIIASNEFYDYEAKYSDQASSDIIIPATLKKETSDQIKTLAVKAFEALDGVGLSRVDFFADEQNGKIRINEINTLPGFTSISMYPKLFINDGMTYSQILDELVDIALSE